MDAKQFDRLARSISGTGTRRRILGLAAGLPLLGGLAAFLEAGPDDADAKGRRKRRKKKHKHGKGRHKGEKKRCKAHAKTKTCAGTCGTVKNNCGKKVNCGSCTCASACPVCQTCDAATLSCVPADLGQPCGEPGEVCQADGNCSCDVCASGCPYDSIQAAIDDPATQEGDTITICAGRYEGVTTVSKSVTLEGAGDGDESGDTILDGNLAGTVVTIFNEQTVTLRNLRITRGRATTSRGGGVGNFGALTMEDCTVIDNESLTSDGGAGIYQNNPATGLTATNCTIAQNRATSNSGFGGGIRSINGPSLTLTGCVLRDNTSGSTPFNGAGGGLYLSPSANPTYTLTGCQVGPDNQAGAGGGIFAIPGTKLILDETTIIDNHATAATGGGLRADFGAEITLRNGSVVRENTAVDSGGGIWNLGTLEIDDSSVGPDNTAGGSGGGIYNMRIPIPDGPVGAITLSGGSAVSENHATTAGGGIFNKGTVDCSGGDVSDNTAGASSATSNCIDDVDGSGCAACPA